MDSLRSIWPPPGCGTSPAPRGQTRDI
jgi:hypothetical protein